MLAVTGHRPDRLGGYSPHAQQRLEVFARHMLVAMRPDHVATGMALGWDQAIAQACVDLGVRYTAVIPGFAGGVQHGSRWPAHSRARYERLLAAAAHVEQRPPQGAGQEFYDRDQRLVQLADEMLALWCGEPSGTGITVRLAHETGVPVWNCWQEWLAYAQ